MSRTPGWSKNVWRKILLVEKEQRLTLPVHPLTHWPASQPGFPGLSSLLPKVTLVQLAELLFGPGSRRGLRAVRPHPLLRCTGVSCAGRDTSEKHGAAPSLPL